MTNVVETLVILPVERGAVSEIVDCELMVIQRQFYGERRRRLQSHGLRGWIRQSLVDVD